MGLVYPIQGDTKTPDVGGMVPTSTFVSNQPRFRVDCDLADAFIDSSGARPTNATSPRYELDPADGRPRLAWPASSSVAITLPYGFPFEFLRGRALDSIAIRPYAVGRTSTGGVVVGAGVVRTIVGTINGGSGSLGGIFNTTETVESLGSDSAFTFDADGFDDIYSTAIAFAGGAGAGNELYIYDMWVEFNIRGADGG